MADPNVDAKDGQDAGGNGGKTTTTSSTDADPSPALKGLQRVISEKDNELKQLREKLAKHEGEPSVEEELAKARAEKAELEGQLAVAKAKAEYPELADVIDTAVAEGIRLTPGVLTVLRERVKSARPETSGLRPGGTTKSSGPSEEEKVKEMLKGTQLW